MIPVDMPNETVQKMAGHCLIAWAMHNARMLEIARRPYGIYDGEIKGVTLFHAPPLGVTVPEVKA